jgi:RND family efflux transporter MFP subunit
MHGAHGRLRWLRRSAPALAQIGVLMALSGGLACGDEAEGGPPGRGGGHGGGHGGPGRGGPGGKQTVAVDVIKTSAATIVQGYEVSGTLEARQSAEIRPTQAGILRSISVEEGDIVEKGSVLAKLDGRELSLQAKRDTIAAENLDEELDRLERVGQAAIAAEEIELKRHAVESARATAALSKHQMSQTQVRAPFAGTISKRYVDVGNLVSNTSVLFDLADLTSLELPLHVPEREAARISTGAPVSISALGGEAFQGSVLRRSPVVDAVTGTVKFTIEVGAERPPAAIPGAFVRATIQLQARENVPSLPDSALTQIEEVWYAWTIVEGKAHRVPLELGLRGGGRSEIVSGIEPGQTIIEDARDVTEGMPVKAFGGPEEPPTDASTSASWKGKGKGKGGGGGRGRARGKG